MIVFSLALLLCAQSFAQAPLPSSPRRGPLMLGTAWYPEQWPESRWDADLALMQQAGIHMVRVGEFAWSRMEPSEGQYDLDWLDHAVAAAAKHGIVTVIGTPSAAPPAWLTQKYPETLRTKEDGRQDQHGNRQQFNWANPKYRELARAMAEQLAKRFGHNPNVIGWQIDNEYADVVFRRGDEGAISAMVEAAVRDSRQLEYAVDDVVLERDVFRLEPGSDPNRLRQSRPAVELDAICQRHMAELSEEPARGDSGERRSEAIHHDEHDGMVRRLRSLHGRAGPGPGFVGRLRGTGTS